MKKIILALALTSVVLTGCSSDEEIMNTSATGAIETKSAVDKIFTVEKVADDIRFIDVTANAICTDLDGNFYYSKKSSSDIMKYDLLTKETTVAFTIPEEFATNASICIDNQKNLYYRTIDRLLKISGANGNVTDLTPRIPFPAMTESVVLCGITAAENGNVFLSGYAYYKVSETGTSQLQQIFKITQQGKITEVVSYKASDELMHLKASDLFKSKGSFVYVLNGSGYLKINTTDGGIEIIPFHKSVSAISATHSKDNPYALRGSDIVRLRPTQESDLLIGTIPSYIMNENGELVKLGSPRNFCMNPEATVFYLMSYDSNHGSEGVCYKLTLE